MREGGTEGDRQGETDGEQAGHTEDEEQVELYIMDELISYRDTIAWCGALLVCYLCCG